MTGSELRAIRKRLGVSSRWCAEHVGGVNRRTWQFWEAGRNGQPLPIPDDVQRRMIELERVMVGVLD